MNISTKQSSIVIIIVTLLLFSRALFCDFVNYDDPQYVYLNPAIKILDWQFIAESFTTSYMGWWMPLTWISFAVDYHFWGLNPLGYHLTNILFHAANSALVVFIADKLLGFLRGNGAADERGSHLYLVPLLAGFLWGIHPLRVESVAWVTERKDVLSGFFSFVSFYVYLRRDFSDGTSVSLGFLTRNYLLALVFFLLALLTKPVSVVIPAMFLVLDWYPLGRLRQGRVAAVLVEKIPFFILSVAIAAATIYFAAGETILVSLTDYPLHKRLLIAGYALTEYMRLSLYPLNLVHLYALPTSFSPYHYTFAGTTVLLTGYVIFLHKKHPFLLSTWLLYVLPLLPVLGFLQNGIQSHADRFTYLPSLFPSITVAVLIVNFYEYLCKRSRVHGGFFVGIVIGALLFFGGITVTLIGSWQNSATLWSRLIAIKPVGRAYYYRGEHYLRSGQYAEAISDFEKSISLAKERGVPGIFNIHALLGDALSRSGRVEEALKQFTIAIEMKPVPNFFYHRGLAYQKLGRTAEADNDFKIAGSANGPIVWNGF